MAVNHQHLRAFHAIALEGSFSRAARRLNVAQPTLSQQIKALEDRHQAVLFEGRRPPLRLTPIGRELFALTQRMFATSDEIDELLDDRIDTGSGSVRIGADSPVYAARLAQALMQAHADMVVEARIDNAGDAMRCLQDAKVDVAILSDPAMDGQFFYEPIFADYLQVVLPVGHRLARSPVFPLAALAEERVIIREPASKTRAAMETLMASAGVFPAQVMELHSREAIREAIALGMGVSLFFSSDCPPDTRLALVRPDRQGERAQLTGYLVGRVERRRTAMMRAVLTAAQTLKALSPLPLHAPAPRAVSAPGRPEASRSAEPQLSVQS
ncbi:LysR substrate-binding domain-containing protein [Caulobacter sp. KR2-114]|uniref:LysR substrate-binding domain-containing protein n=1 Tax=Caulobacter sp. KR2-114 TaxID=3400912 RepID=UPI003C0A69CE